MLVLHILYRNLVILIYLLQCLVPILIKLLILHQMCLFHFFFFFSLVVYLFLSLPLKILLFQLFYSIFGHLCLHILTLLLTLLSVLLQHSTIIILPFKFLHKIPNILSFLAFLPRTIFHLLIHLNFFIIT